MIHTYNNINYVPCDVKYDMQWEKLFTEVKFKMSDVNGNLFLFKVPFVHNLIHNLEMVLLVYNSWMWHKLLLIANCIILHLGL